MNLFEQNQNYIPLAERVRPSKLSEVIGHENITSENSALLKSLKNGRTVSFVLWGSPGVGKTTIARLVAKEIDAHFISISAVTSGVKDLRESIEKARQNRDRFQVRTVLFIDEIHRFSKSQQDALLHAVENGTILLIGATTENPSFEVNAALLSRMQVFSLNELTGNDLQKIIIQAIEKDDFYKSFDILFEDISLLIHLSGADARKLLSIFETAFDLAKKDDEKVEITKNNLLEAAENIKSPYDKKADYHYDTISAFIKSVRGSDPDAAVLWLARMLDGGEDPIFIARRLIILASEDIGNADPNALLLATSALTSVKAIGMPEARIILSQVTTYLASTNKSNAAYLAIDSALEDIQKNPQITVPLHLRNAPTKLMKKNDYGKNYQYPHNFESGFVKQNYFPKEIYEKNYYNPTMNGRELKLRERLIFLWDRLKK
jgi:putative ATPase